MSNKTAIWVDGLHERGIYRFRLEDGSMLTDGAKPRLAVFKHKGGWCMQLDMGADWLEYDIPRKSRDAAIRWAWKYALEVLASHPRG